MYVSQNHDIIYQANYGGWTSCMSNYFYCQIRQEGLLYEAQRDLLAIAVFLVELTLGTEQMDRV